MTTLKTTQAALSNLEEEMKFFNELTEEQACQLYNVDYKAEAIEYIQDWWN